MSEDNPEKYATDEIDRHLARYLAQVAEALDSVPKCDPGYGEFYVSKATISFDGEETNYAVVADEHGTYAVQVRVSTGGSQ